MLHYIVFQHFWTQSEHLISNPLKLLKLPLFGSEVLKEQDFHQNL
jgi:hypothetical protein